MDASHINRILFAGFLLTALLIFSREGVAEEKTYRVAVIAHSPPLSYTGDNGKLTGFNIEMAHELCESMKVRCVLQPMPIEKIVDAVADEMDFAVVGFIVTPERQRKVLFSKHYFESLSVWVAKPSVAPGNTTSKVVVIKGSAQARYAEAIGWTMVQVLTQKEIAPLLSSGEVDAAIIPMMGALSLMQEKLLQSSGFKTTVLSEPSLTGSLHMIVNPRQPKLVERINSAIDQLKRDGRFDRINTQFIPFRLL